MFVPVACSHCGKPFQVPDAAVGTSTVCPWCQAAVLALPVGGTPAPAPVATTPGDSRPPARRAEPPGDSRPPARPPAPEPLPLDDEPPAPRPGFRFRLWMVPAGLLVLSVAAGATVGVLRYKQGHMVGWEWRAFTPPDKSFAVDLLGRAREDPDAAAGETRFVCDGWYSGTTAWVGWRDLTQVQKQLADTKDAWRHFGNVFETEQARLKNHYGGSAKGATKKFEGPLTHEIRLEYPGGRAVERVLVMPGGPRPRVYFVGMAGRIDPDGPEAQRLFDSFRVNE